MRIVVFGPDMESRSLAEWALTVVPESNLTAVEIVILRLAKELHHHDGAVVIGPPWVNPLGQGRLRASIDDYLQDPVRLRQALTVALAREGAADKAFVLSFLSQQKQLEEARQWVMSRIPGHHADSITWSSIEDDFKESLRCQPHYSPADTLAAREEARTVEIAEVAYLGAFRVELARVFGQ